MKVFLSRYLSYFSFMLQAFYTIQSNIFMFHLPSNRGSVMFFLIIVWCKVLNGIAIVSNLMISKSNKASSHAQNA